MIPCDSQLAIMACFRQSKTPENVNDFRGLLLLRGQDLNLRPSGYEPDGGSSPTDDTSISWIPIVLILDRNASNFLPILMIFGC